MAFALHALFVHGVGQQEADFADEAKGWLADTCHERSTKLYAGSVHWAPMADLLEEKFLKQVEKRGSRGNMTQRLVVGTLTDALVYQANAQLRERIFSLVDQHILRMRGEHLTVFAHSLGGLIMTDYLRTRAGIKNVTLVTLGCNLGLFNLGSSFKPVPQLSAPGRWFNVFDRDDMLGYPLRGDANLKHVSDVEVSLGGWFTGWTGRAHVMYWGDKKLWRRTVPNLLAI